MSISKSYNEHGPYSPSNEFCLTSSLNNIFYHFVSCLFCCLMQYTIAKAPRLVQWIQFRKPLLHRPSLMKTLQDVKVNSLSQSRLVGETTNNQLELLSQNYEWDGNTEHILCPPIACTLFEIVAITNYALLWNTTYSDQYELQHFAEESQHVVSHCIHLSARNMNWKEQENFALPFAVESQLPSENICGQFDFYRNVHFICFTKKSEWTYLNFQIRKKNNFKTRYCWAYF